MNLPKVLAAISLFCLIALVINDSYFHFDAERVSIKRQAKSAQRHWSLFYTQHYTYTDSSFKYRNDIEEIQKIITPGKTLLADRATSYYLAAELPIFVKNLHAHHSRDLLWVRFLQQRLACYIDLQDQYEEVLNFIETVDKQSLNGLEPEFKYWVFNSDAGNLNLRNDCLSMRGSDITSALPKFAKQLFKGEYLWLYEIN